MTIAIAVHGGAGSADPPRLPVESRNDAGGDPAKARAAALGEALAAGREMLEQGGSALDAVERAVCVLEDSPSFNAGTGSVLNWEGGIEMDASVMTEGDAFGGVGCLRAVRNPVRAARAVLEETDHWLLCGQGALAFARAHAWGAPWDPERPERRAQWRILREEILRAAREKNGPASPALAHRERLVSFVRDHPEVAGAPGTVGAVAIDGRGRAAAATSTGGVWLKLPGRVGDSALAGAGTFVGAGGAVSATGHGEAIMRIQLARRVELFLRETDAASAAARAVEEARAAGCACGVIAVDRRGRPGFAFNTEAMPAEVWRG